MTKQVINVGSTENDGTGDTIRTGGQKINNMVEEIYLYLGNGTNITANTRNVVSNTYLQATYTTNAIVRGIQTELYTSNTVLRSLIAANTTSTLATMTSGLNDRMQVANTNNLVNDRLQVANANITFVTKAVALASNNSVVDYINVQIGASNTNIRSFTDQSYATKAVVLASNTALKNLINDKMQVANTTNLVNDRMQVANVNTLVLDRMQVANSLAIGLSSVAFYNANDTLVFTKSDTNQLKVTLDGVATNSYSTIIGDSGSTTANLDTDTLTLTGNNGIETFVSGDTLKAHLHRYEPSIASLEVTANGVAGYLFGSHYPTALGNNPTLYAISGTTLAFDLRGLSAHPFAIQDTGSTNYSNNLIYVAPNGAVSEGAAAQGKYGGILYWRIPYNVTGNFKYQCTSHGGMNGTITIKDINAI